jgi:hypothetical protein
VPATFTVTNVLDSGAGSLRQAILSANLTANVPDGIHFNIPGTGPHTISATWSGLTSKRMWHGDLQCKKCLSIIARHLCIGFIKYQKQHIGRINSQGDLNGNIR